MWNDIQIQCSDPSEIAEALINKEVTLSVLNSVPAFAAKANLVEEETWSMCKRDSSFQSYLNIYPDGKYAGEANAKKRAQMEEGKVQAEKEKVIKDLENDRNAYTLGYIQSLNITAADLYGKIKDSRGFVRNEVLKSWGKSPKALNMGRTPDFIPEGSTEVYFWGVPGSGKTCAMAAILSQASRMGYLAPRIGEGLGYMNDLASVFQPQREYPAVCLPPASDVDTTQYLPLTLNETVEGRRGKKRIFSHNLSVIEISGEIFECFSLELEDKPFPSTAHKETFNRLKSYLMDETNPKYHFFMLDSKPLIDSQQRHLQNAALYFTEKDIFNSTTQGISLIVTKSDELSSDKAQWVRCAEQAAREYFSPLVNQLRLIVGDPADGGLGLTDGSLSVIPLSIGEVFFQSLCLFDPEPATELVKMLLEYSKVAERNDWKKKIKRNLRK